jgi:hypothetical protein
VLLILLHTHENKKDTINFLLPVSSNGGMKTTSKGGGWGKNQKRKEKRKTTICITLLGGSKLSSHST